ncbi:MAG: SAM-dependent methyltransferase [Devosia sp.]
MKERRKRISTARGVAMVRALEMTRPAAERISSDPLAAGFVNPFAVQGMRLMVASGLARLLGIEAMINFAVARERCIEEFMAREIADGCQQIVILGAGFDTRVYRLAGAAQLSIFEVDHPVTQEGKREALGAVGDAVPDNVRFVAVDFERDDLGERLRAEGYDEASRTLFVWQGVSMYLTAEGIDRTLGFVAHHAGPDSAIVFDYFDESAMRSGEAAMTRLFTALMGEAVHFGIDQREIVSFLSARGYRDIDNVDSATLASRFLVGSNARRPMASGVNVVTARVA